MYTAYKDSEYLSTESAHRGFLVWDPIGNAIIQHLYSIRSILDQFVTRLLLHLFQVQPPLNEGVLSLLRERLLRLQLPRAQAAPVRREDRLVPVPPVRPVVLPPPLPRLLGLLLALSLLPRLRRTLLC